MEWCADPDGRRLTPRAPTSRKRWHTSKRLTPVFHRTRYRIWITARLGIERICSFDPSQMLAFGEPGNVDRSAKKRTPLSKCGAHRASQTSVCPSACPQSTEVRGDMAVRPQYQSPAAEFVDGTTPFVTVDYKQRLLEIPALHACGLIGLANHARYREGRDR